MNRTFSAAGLFAALAIVAAAAGGDTPAAPPRPSILGQAYIQPADLPDATLFIGPPPQPGSSAEARDHELSEKSLKLYDGPRWRLAIVDADLFTPKAPSVMSCAAGIEIGPGTTPATNRLLRMSAASLGYSTATVKRKYQRPRPFTVNGKAQCTPEMDGVLRKDGSYPSGHSAIGYGWGLILAELLPDRSAQLMARGIAFGDSRRVCNVHWASDVEAGRLAGAAVVAKLHANQAFAHDLKAARKELAKARSFAPKADCAAEAAALAL